MSDEQDHKLEAKSDYVADASSVSTPDIDAVPAAELPDQELYHSHSWWTTYVFSQDAKYIGIQYALTAIGTGLLGLVLSWLMRIQLAFPGLGWLEPSSYYQFVTMHGMIMVVYLLTALFLGGFGNLLIPLMCGARDMAFPYVNMLSYWAFVVAVLVLLASFFVPGGPTGAGWTLYPPQAITAGTPGYNGGIILMLISLILFVAGFTMGGLNYIITVLQLRARGMTLMRMPLTIWGIFTATVLAMFAFPALLVGCLMMTLDSLLGTSFFMPAMVSLGEKLTHEGGSPILFQHLFWFFGHPEVYIVALPAFGIVSDLLSVHSRKTIFGYRMMVWAIVGIGALSFFVWAHHMYVSGMNPWFGFFFATTTLIIAVPTAIKVYNWIDVPLSDTYFVVAHFHMVMGIAPILVIFGAIYHWYPLITGRMMDETLGKIHFWITFLGSYAIYFPMHYQGFVGVPRRYFEIYDSPYIDTSTLLLNKFITIAVLIVGAAQLLFLYNLFASARLGKKSEKNPWKANSLEWQTPQMPPEHGNWGKELPKVYRWPYDFSVPGAKEDYIPQNQPPSEIIGAKVEKT